MVKPITPTCMCAAPAAHPETGREVLVLPAVLRKAQRGPRTDPGAASRHLCVQKTCKPNVNNDLQSAVTGRNLLPRAMHDVDRLMICFDRRMAASPELSSPPSASRATAWSRGVTRPLWGCWYPNTRSSRVRKQLTCAPCVVCETQKVSKYMRCDNGHICVALNTNWKDQRNRHHVHGGGRETSSAPARNTLMSHDTFFEYTRCCLNLLNSNYSFDKLSLCNTDL